MDAKETRAMARVIGDVIKEKIRGPNSLVGLRLATLEESVVDLADRLEELTAAILADAKDGDE